LRHKDLIGGKELFELRDVGFQMLAEPIVEVLFLGHGRVEPSIKVVLIDVLKDSFREGQGSVEQDLDAEFFKLVFDGLQAHAGARDKIVLGRKHSFVMVNESAQ
jgi:hypothetical protein